MLNDPFKEGNHNGHYRHYTDSMIHGTDHINTYLAIMFTGILTNGYTPNDMPLFTIVPIPPNARKSLNDSNNYTLSSAIGKLFDGYS